MSLALGALIPFLPLAYLTWRAYAGDVARVEREIEDTNRQIARLAANYLDELVLRIKQEASANRADLPSPSDAVRWERVGPGGEVLASQLAPGRVGAPAGYERFLATFAGTDEARFSGVDRWIGGMAPTVVAARRGAGTGGASFLVGVVDPDALYADMTARSGELLDRHVYAVDGMGHLLFYSDAEISRRGGDLTSNPPVRLHLGGGTGPIRFSSVVSRKPRLGFVQRLGGLDWSVVVSADIGSRLERELVQAEKASLLGQLASGVAHEIGTPLNVMSGNAQYLLRKLSPEDPARAALQHIVGQAERVTEMVQQLLDFARPTAARHVPFELGEVVVQALEMVSPMLRHVDVRVDVDPDTPPVVGDPRLLEHALLNLVVNACQAMPGGGRLSLVVGAGVPREALRGVDERWVYCLVSDSGCGIAPENLERIFQPFYTTKAQGQGTGLGLAIVERIVRQLQGTIEVSSRQGSGTTFTIGLRAAARPA